MPDQTYFLTNLSFIKFQTVEFQHVSSSTFAWVFRVLAQLIQVFSRLFELQFSWVWALSVKTRWAFEFWVAWSGTGIYFFTKNDVQTSLKIGKLKFALLEIGQFRNLLILCKQVLLKLKMWPFSEDWKYLNYCMKLYVKNCVESIR